MFGLVRYIWVWARAQGPAKGARHPQHPLPDHTCASEHVDARRRGAQDARETARLYTVDYPVCTKDDPALSIGPNLCARSRGLGWRHRDGAHPRAWTTRSCRRRRSSTIESGQRLYLLQARTPPLTCTGTHIATARFHTREPTHSGCASCRLDYWLTSAWQSGHALLRLSHSSMHSVCSAWPHGRHLRAGVGEGGRGWEARVGRGKRGREAREGGERAQVSRERRRGAEAWRELVRAPQLVGIVKLHPADGALLAQPDAWVGARG